MHVNFGTVKQGFKSLLVEKKLSAYIGDKIYSTTGLMTNKTLVRNAQRVGAGVVELQAQKKDVVIEDIIEILEKVLGKEQAQKFGVIKNKEELLSVLEKNLNVSGKAAESFYNNSLSAAIPKGAGSKSFLDLRINSIQPEKLAGVAAHETEHVLFHNFSFTHKFIGYLTGTKLGKKALEKALSLSDSYNMKLMDVQGNLIYDVGEFGITVRGYSENPQTMEGLLKQCDCKDMKELHSKIREMLFSKRIFEVGENKQNAKLASGIKGCLKDEARAYSAGGSIDDLYQLSVNGTPATTATNSELCSMLYKEAAKVMNEEKRFSKKHRLGELLGHKPKYTREQKIIESAKRKEAERWEAKDANTETHTCSIDDLIDMIKNGIFSKGEVAELSVHNPELAQRIKEIPELAETFKTIL